MTTKQIVLALGFCLGYMSLVAGGTVLMQGMSANAANCTESRP